MFIVDCLPFSKALNKDLLSYFSSIYLEPGSLVKVNIRNRPVLALVIQSKEAREMKSEIRGLNFQVKKISSLTSKPFLRKEFLEAVRKTANYFASTEGAVLSQLLPAIALENPNLLTTPKNFSTTVKNQTQKDFDNKRGVVAAIQTENDERFLHYRSLIREEFAKKRSVFFCLPQNEGVLQLKEKLERGIESFVCAFYKDMGKNDFKKEWKKATANSHPVVIIGTSRWLFTPRNDFGAIVIEKENESGWKTITRPFLDLRFFAEAFGKSLNARIILGDSLLRTETLYRYKQTEITNFESVKWRLSVTTQTLLVDLKETTRKDSEFKTLSPEILDLAEETIKKGSNMFIFAARKGLSPITICRDCGEQVKCNNCLSPMILHKSAAASASTVFVCHQCGETRDSAEVCQNCKSWKLAAFGSGVDKVASEIKKNFPGLSIFEIHKDVASTNTRAINIVKDFYEKKGAILVGTEMAFSYLHKKVGASAIASFDSLFSIPDFRIREKIFRVILQTQDISKGKFLIQSRNLEDPTIHLSISGNLLDFYTKEIEDRRALSYPPFGTFIKITARGTKNFIAKETENLKNIFKEYDPIVFNSVQEKKGEPSAVNAIIKLRKENWPDPVLIQIVRSIPTHFEVKIDPENLL